MPLRHPPCRFLKAQAAGSSRLTAEMEACCGFQPRLGVGERGSGRERRAPKTPKWETPAPGGFWVWRYWRYWRYPQPDIAGLFSRVELFGLGTAWFLLRVGNCVPLRERAVSVRRDSWGRRRRRPQMETSQRVCTQAPRNWRLGLEAELRSSQSMACIFCWRSLLQPRVCFGLELWISKCQALVLVEGG